MCQQTKGDSSRFFQQIFYWKSDFSLNVENKTTHLHFFNSIHFTSIYDVLNVPNGIPDRLEGPYHRFFSDISILKGKLPNLLNKTSVLLNHSH